MIVGQVNADLEITIRFHVRGSAGQAQAVEAILDTGFNGALTLPAGAIATWGLPLRTQSTAILADGSVQTFDVHVAAIHWNGRWQTILIQSIDADPLLGMALIAGHDLNARVIDGGRVEIEAIP
jgi:clan AA aspartic protease